MRDNATMRGTLHGQLAAAHVTGQVLAGLPEGPGLALAGWKQLLSAVATEAAHDGVRVTWLAVTAEGGPCRVPMPGADAVTCQLPAGHAGRVHSSAAGAWTEPIPASGWGQ